MTKNPVGPKARYLFSAETRNYLCSRSVHRFGMGYLSEIKEGSAYQRDGKQNTW